MRSAIQLYSLRDVDEPLSEIVRRVAEAGYDGVEFAHRVRGDDADPAAVADALDDTGLDVPAGHVGPDQFGDGFGETADFYRSLDCERLVVAWMDPEYFEDAEGVSEAADVFDDCAEQAGDAGFGFAYHNHTQEFVDIGEVAASDASGGSSDEPRESDGETAFDRLAAETGIDFELDVAWVAAGGVDPAALIERYADRVPLLHVADAAEEGSTESANVGEGIVDHEAVADAARDADVEWAIYEHDDPDDPLAAMERGAEEIAARYL